MTDNLFPAAPGATSPVAPDPLVFHYASSGAALGLIGNSEVWGSKIQFLNDDQEFREYLNFLVRSAEDNIAIDEVGQTFCDELIDRVDRIRQASIYVASFSEEGDKLSQWRGYCPDGGYAVGFRRSQLSDHFSKCGFSFQKAIYDLPTKDNVVKRLRSLFEQYRLSGQSESKPEELDNFFSDYMREIAVAAPLYKHKGFQEENEWRVFSNLTAWDDPNVDVVTVRGALRPIYKFKLPKTIISDQLQDIGIDTVKVAPGRDGELRSDAIRILLRRKGIYYRTIESSSLPYNAR